MCATSVCEVIKNVNVALGVRLIPQPETGVRAWVNPGAAADVITAKTPLYKSPAGVGPYGIRCRQRKRWTLILYYGNNLN